MDEEMKRSMNVLAGVAVAVTTPLAVLRVASVPIPASIDPSPTPSFSIAATVIPTTLPLIAQPGEEVQAGGSYIFTGPDGTQYRVYEQTNRILGTGPTPTPTPTPSPTPSPTPAPVVSAYDDSAFTYFGTWGMFTGAGKYGPGDHFTQSGTASYGFLFTGTGVTLYTQTAPWMAIVAVSVDGAPAVEFDAYAATQTQQVPFFRSGSLAPGVHRIIATHTGRTNPAGTSLAGGGQQVTVDRADITDGAIIPPLAAP